jgi:2-aminoethylphosphonate-pyruvate transaminase
MTSSRTPGDKLLFTPGPLTTSATVKQAMLCDLGSRDGEFLAAIRDVRSGLLQLAGVSQELGYETVPLQGSGTYAIEAVISSAVPATGKLLVAVNGAYGERMVKIAEVHGIAVEVLRFPEASPVEPDAVEACLQSDPSITHVAIVHCETTSGVMNPIAEVGKAVAVSGRSYIVDSMSAFGAVPLDVRDCRADFLVSSANKCIEGVPGFAFAICRRESLESCRGQARSLALDLEAQWRGLEANGQFRFTPPTHALLAFRQALIELEAEGGVEGRAARYGQNHACLREGMARLGFQELVPAEHQGNIITSFLYPQDDGFEFERFYEGLNQRGFVIYPGKVTDADCFRIGSIGRLFPSDMEALLTAIAETMQKMGLKSKAVSASE